MSEQEMRERQAKARREGIYDSVHMKAQRANKTAGPTPADTLRRRHLDERTELGRQHHAEGSRLTQKHQPERGEHARRHSAPLAGLDRRQAQERTDLIDKHKRQRGAMEKRHLAETDKLRR